ncbi:DUF2516 family protein [Streptomyces sp. NPDC001380]|uniref:DUF2516 family protein n=1 Tax=Streptomyces sp. NPDC001380 TaxID=3364566 RepID=UPI0036A7293E
MSLDWLNPMWWLVTGVIVFKIVALADAAVRREDAYPAADKKTKAFWLLVLGLAVVLDLLFTNSVFGIFVLAGLVAAIVYMVDVRPAVRAVSGGGSGGNRRNAGPYGPR